MTSTVSLWLTFIDNNFTYSGVVFIVNLEHISLALVLLFLSILFLQKKSAKQNRKV